MRNGRGVIIRPEDKSTEAEWLDLSGGERELFETQVQLANGMGH